MSATKEVKIHLDELRAQLDPDQAAFLEPILRKILDAAKPKMVPQIEYRGDPRDKADIESLRATIHLKDEAIHKLQNKLADQPPPPKLIHSPPSAEHLPRKQRLDELSNRAKAWIEWARQCMVLMADNDDDRRQRKELLTILVGSLTLPMCNYLNLMEGLRSKVQEAEIEALVRIVNNSMVDWLKNLSDDIRTATGNEVDLELFAKQHYQITTRDVERPRVDSKRARARRPKKR